MSDPFDPARLALTLPQSERWATTPRKITKRREHFVKMPWIWVERLTRARYISTYRVALHILYQHWKENGESFTLANGILRLEGVERRAKWRALCELERLGLIAIERRKRKTPRITILSCS
jgi:hypothetical protein